MASQFGSLTCDTRVLVDRKASLSLHLQRIYMYLNRVISIYNIMSTIEMEDQQQESLLNINQVAAGGYITNESQQMVTRPIQVVCDINFTCLICDPISLYIDSRFFVSLFP